MLYDVIQGYGRKIITRKPLMGRESSAIIRVIITPAVYPRLFEFIHVDIHSTGQKSFSVLLLSALNGDPVFAKFLCPACMTHGDNIQIRA